MASGTPVVGFSYAALREFIEDGISGVLADYDLGKVLERTIKDDKVEKRNAFVKAALRAVDSPLMEMGMRAREVVVNRFSPKRFLTDFLSNIDRVITQQGTGQRLK
jgi:glycosyltransferase involved in cell wall biosynthesis